MARQHMALDWALGTQGAIADLVRAVFPADLRGWPLMQPFAFDAYTIGETHMVIVLHDQVHGGPLSGPHHSGPFPHGDHPPLPSSASDARPWQDYLNQRLDLRTEDAAIILPVHDSGVSSAPRDYALFSKDERDVWIHQVNQIVERQAPVFATKQQVSVVNNYYNPGPSPRAVLDTEAKHGMAGQSPVDSATAGATGTVAYQKPTCVVTFPSDDRGEVQEGTCVKVIKGRARTWVFRSVYEASPQVVTWEELLGAKLRRDGVIAEDRAGRSPMGRSGFATPSLNLTGKSLQQHGARIRNALSKLGYHWHQDGRGARWDPEVQ